MSEIEINLTLKFNIPDEDLNVNGLLFGLKGANSQTMLAITIENISEDDKSKVHQLCQRTEDDFDQLMKSLILKSITRQELTFKIFLNLFLHFFTGDLRKTNGFLLPVILSKIVSAKSKIESKGLE